MDPPSKILILLFRNVESAREGWIADGFQCSFSREISEDFGFYSVNWISSISFSTRICFLLGSDFSIVVVGQDVKLWIHWPLQKCTGLLLLLLPPLCQLLANELFPLPVCQEEVLQKYLAHWTKHTGFLYSPHFHLWPAKLHQELMKEYRSLSGFWIWS